MQTRPFDVKEYEVSVLAGKPLQVVTREEFEPVRILATDAPGMQTVIGIHGNDIEFWNEDGRYLRDGGTSPLDLVFTEPREFSDAECEADIEAAIPQILDHSMRRLLHWSDVLTVVRYLKGQIELAKGGAR